MFISNAFAEAGTSAAAPGFNMLLLVGMVVVFWLFIIRPQSKRQKVHREMVKNVATGDEVLTNGGFAGKVVEVDEHFVVLAIAANVNVQCQKLAIASLLPKGTVSLSKG